MIVRAASPAIGTHMTRVPRPIDDTASARSPPPPGRKAFTQIFVIENIVKSPTVTATATIQ